MIERCCIRCGCKLPEVYHSLLLQEEKGNGGAIQILNSEELASYCKDCSPFKFK